MVYSFRVYICLGSYTTVLWYKKGKTSNASVHSQYFKPMDYFTNHQIVFDLKFLGQIKFGFAFTLQCVIFIDCSPMWWSLNTSSSSLVFCTKSIKLLGQCDRTCWILLPSHSILPNHKSDRAKTWGIAMTQRFRIAKIVPFWYPSWPPWQPSWNSSKGISHTIGSIEPKLDGKLHSDIEIQNC